MEGQNPIDDIFRNKLNRYDSGIPENLWQKIEDRRRPKRRGGWLFFLAIGLGLGVMAFVFSKNKTENAFPKSNTAAVASEVSAFEKPALEQSEISVSKTVFSEREEKLPAVKLKKPAFKNPVVNQIVGRENENLLPSLPLAAEEKNTTQILKEELVLETPVAQQKWLLAFLPDLKTRLGFPTQKPDLTLPDPEACFSFTPNLFGSFYVDLYGGPGYALRNLKDQSSGEPSDFAALRDSTERSLYAFGLGLRASALWRSGLVLRAGLSYLQINEVFDYENERAVRTTINEIFDASGNIIRRDTIVETGTRLLTTNNRFKYWDIPIMLGYELDGKKSSLSFNAGVSINISSSQKGQMLDPQTFTPVHFDDKVPENRQLFETNAGLSVIASVAYSHEIAKNLHWTLEPHFRYFTKSLTYQQPVEQRYGVLSLHTGLRYYFQ